MNRRIKDIKTAAAEILRIGEPLSFRTIAADGSARVFMRVYEKETPLCVIVFPPDTGKAAMAEFRSTLTIGKHLGRVGVPVPEVIGADERLGLVIFEDLGDIRLHEASLENREKRAHYYSQAVRALVKMQTAGAQGFDRDWCFDTPEYDRSVMLERESGYFHRAFWQQLLLEDEVEGLNEEFHYLADKVMKFFTPLFLHRDYQSRNIMISGDEVRIIDFQAGRLGPPGYDIASLLIDPYTGLSNSFQNEMFALYLDELGRIGEIETGAIAASYPFLAVQRNLQIIGAFAYLSSRKKKPFFSRYILPSLIMLQNRLADPVFDEMEVLRKTVGIAIRNYRNIMRG